jgi:outer membrane protein assembly factor BamB
LPTSWEPGKGIAWRRELPGWGASTPVVWGEAIFVTAEAEGALLLLRLSQKTGEIEWKRQVGTGAAPRMPLRLKSAEERKAQMFHSSHNLASPSPVTDGERVIVHFGSGELAAFDLAGKELWKRNLQEDHGQYTIWWGRANSPVLHDGLVITICLQDSLADLGGAPVESYLVAHDARTGKQAWKTTRRTNARTEQCDSYVTPVFHRVGDAVEMIVMGANEMDAYDPRTGQRLWRLPGLDGNRVITGTTLGHGLAYSTIGMRGALVAVKLGQKGDLTPEAIAWRHTKGTPDSPTPVLWGDILFLVSDGGVATALDARTGAVHWTERLPGEYRASPIAAEGRIYFTSMDGVTTIVAAAARFEKLATSRIEDDNVVASIAVAGGRLYLRGKKALWCIGP